MVDVSQPATHGAHHIITGQSASSRRGANWICKMRRLDQVHNSSGPASNDIIMLMYGSAYSLFAERDVVGAQSKMDDSLFSATCPQF